MKRIRQIVLLFASCLLLTTVALADTTMTECRFEDTVKGTNAYVWPYGSDEAEIFDYDTPEDAVTMLIFYGSDCGNSQSLFSNMAKCDWVDDPRVNIIAVQSTSYQDDAEQFFKYYGRGMEEYYDIYCGGNNLNFSYLRLLFPGITSTTAPTVLMITNEDGTYYIRNCSTGHHSIDKHTEVLMKLLMENCVTQDGVTYAILGSTATVVDCEASVTAVNIPQTIQGATVKYIQSEAFADCTALTTVTLPDTIERIGEAALSGCTSLTAITVPEKVETIGASTFSGCKSLAEVTLPDGLRVIGESAFSDCGALTTVELPANLKEIGASAFAGCAALDEIVVPDTVTEMGRYVFKDCTGLTAAQLPAKMTAVPAGTFQNCESLTEITLPAGAKQIEYNAFDGCTSLSSVEFPASLTTLGDRAFAGTALTSVTLPETFKTLSGAVFTDCKQLKTVELNDTLQSVGSAFKNCTALECIAIPASVERLEGGLFSGCTALYDVTLVEGLKTIGAAFSDCTALKTLVIPDSVTQITTGAFAGSGLVSITLPDGVTILSESMFENCKDLARVVLPAQLTTIEKSAFDGCAALTEIAFPATVTEIGNYAFRNCTALQVSLPTGLKTLGYYAFQNTALTEVTLPASLTSLGSSAFESCDSLQTVTFYAQLESLSDKVFADCTALTAITLPDTITFIDDYAFDGCTLLAKVQLPAALTELGDGVFEDCSSLKEITLPEGITAIGYGAFSGCTSLAAVEIPAGITEIKTSTFQGCTAFTEVTIPAAVTRIRDYAFTGCTNLTAVYFQGDAPTVVSAAKNTASFPKTATLYYSVSTSGWTDSDAYVAATRLWNGYPLLPWDGSPEPILVERIDLGVETLTLDAWGKHALTVSVYPETAENRTLSWTVSDSSVLKVDENGCITAGNTKGTATVTAAATDGSGVTASITVMVANSIHEVTDFTQLASAHPYENNYSDFFYLDTGEDATWRVTFDAKTSFEEGVDYLYIYEADRAVARKFTGKELAGATVDISGSVVEFQLVTNGTTTDWGFAVTAMTKVDSSFITSENADGTVTITGLGRSLSGEVYIPAEIGGKTVTAIGTTAFSGTDAAAITHISIPATVTTIESGAFSGCAALTGFTADGSTSFRVLNDALMSKDCKRLIAYPAALTGEAVIYPLVTTLADRAFAGSQLTKLTANYSIYTSNIGADVFTSAALTLYCHENNPLATYAANHNVPTCLTWDLNCLSLYVSGTATEESGLPRATTLTVKSLTASDFTHAPALAAYTYTGYDITLLYNYQPVQPTAPVTVRINIPSTYDRTKCVVFRVEENGTLTDMKADVKMRTTTQYCMQFETDHFSDYVVAQKGTPSTTDLPTQAITSNNVGGVYDGYAARWAQPAKSYLYEDDGKLVRVEYTGGRVIIEEYNSSYELCSVKELALELPIWGGFYAGENFNYIIVGQENPNEDDSCEVIRVIQYDKDWIRTGSAGLFGANTTVPFDAGGLDCAEYDNLLYVRTCHEMYTSADGLNHQASLTFALRTSDMTILDTQYLVSNRNAGYVSHSFNQHILIDSSGRIVTLDHGDAYPRGAWLFRYTSYASAGRVTSTSGQLYTCGTGIAPVTWDGAIGANATGGRVTGLAETATGYLAAWSDTGLGASSLAGSPAAVYLSYTPKSTFTESSTVVIQVAEDGLEPLLVPTSLYGGYILWARSDGTLAYASYGVDGTVGTVRTAAASRSDCQPILYNGKAVWYVTTGGKPTFYELDENGLAACIKGVDVTGEISSYKPGVETVISLSQDGETLYTVTIAGESGKGKTTRAFTLENVIPGTYDLTVTKAGCLTYTLADLPVGEDAVDLTTLWGTITLLSGDLDGDGRINLSDLATFRENFGKSGSAILQSAADFDGDERVNLTDLAVFRENFGKTASRDSTYVF